MRSAGAAGNIRFDLGTLDFGHVKTRFAASIQYVFAGHCPFLVHHVINFACIEIGAEISAEMFARFNTQQHVSGS